MQRAKLYNIDDTVEHKTFGIGTVVEKYRNGNDVLIVRVHFNNGEIKPIVARFQGMKKIK